MRLPFGTMELPTVLAWVLMFLAGIGLANVLVYAMENLP